MSNAFRELLKKIGSGVHTGESLNRQEAAEAMRMMLLSLATPAQIGAFLIAHRIKRPTGEELAGMLDAYYELGPQLQPVDSSPVVVLGCPYDGRSRTAPVTAIVALLLAAAGQPVVMHGGDRMPTKYGIPAIEIWQGLGADWTTLSLPEVQNVLAKTGLAFVYLPKHFSPAASLVPYRDQIGKRPPLATMELIWAPVAAPHHIAAGFVHPPTENMLRDALALHGVENFTTVKGLEGSCDLPRERTAIVGLINNNKFDRLHLNPRDYGFGGHNPPLSSTAELLENLQALLQGQPSQLMQSALWNGGFYLWRFGLASSLEEGFATAETLLASGKVALKLQELNQAIGSV
ncbi:MAG: anthranilate phosphoribosyltransferase family protein [Oscillatoria sp. SIO1A7]|nr:anthranilate phosphoribosyltransferase family protein [Oscillatoria sp. SIO1A7]